MIMREKRADFVKQKSELLKLSSKDFKKVLNMIDIH